MSAQQKLLLDNAYNKRMEKIVDEIIGQLKEGVPLWRKPWGEKTMHIIIGGMLHRTDMWPSNIRAPRVSFGIEHGLQLLLKGKTEGYKTNLWITKKAVAEVGAEINDGEKGHALHTMGNILPSAYYNIEQITNHESALGLSYEEEIDEKYKADIYEESKKRIEYLKKHKSLKIIEKKNKACYFPLEDIIHMPHIPKKENFHAVLWHEIIHWTGHKSRLNRLTPAIFGDDKYAFEELIAELGAAFICSKLGIEDKCQFASYIDSWIKNFEKNGYKVLHHAGEFAQAAAQHALNKKDKTDHLPTNRPTFS